MGPYLRRGNRNQIIDSASVRGLRTQGKESLEREEPLYFNGLESKDFSGRTVQYKYIVYHKGTLFSLLCRTLNLFCEISKRLKRLYRIFFAVMLILNSVLQY